MGPARCAPWIVASTSPVATSTATSAGALGATRAQATVDGVAQHSADTCAPNVCARRHEFRDTSTTTRHPRSSTAATTELDGSMATDVNRSRSVDDARTVADVVGDAPVVAAVDDAVQPLGREHPGCAYARRAVKAEAATSRRACDALDESLRRTVEADEEADDEENPFA